MDARRFFEAMLNSKVQAAQVLVPVLAVCLLLSFGSVIQYLKGNHGAGNGNENPYYFRAATVKPRSDDLLGRYYLTKQELTIDGLDFLQGQQATIIISGDGKYTVSNFPLWKQDGINRYNFRCRQLISTTGHWRIRGVDRQKGKPLWVVDLEPDGVGLLDKSLRYAIVIGNDPPHSFFFDLGDPDSVRIMLYEKINRAAVSTKIP